jgi:hypothetical protein
MKQAPPGSSFDEWMKHQSDAVQGAAKAYAGAVCGEQGLSVGPAARHLHPLQPGRRDADEAKGGKALEAPPLMPRPPLRPRARGARRVPAAAGRRRRPRRRRGARDARGRRGARTAGGALRAVVHRGRPGVVHGDGGHPPQGGGGGGGWLGGGSRHFSMQCGWLDRRTTPWRRRTAPIASCIPAQPLSLAPTRAPSAAAAPKKVGRLVAPQVRRVVAAVAPRCQGLVNAFGIPDYLVAAPIAADWEFYNRCLGVGGSRGERAAGRPPSVGGHSSPHPPGKRAAQLLRRAGRGCDAPGPAPGPTVTPTPPDPAWTPPPGLTTRASSSGRHSSRREAADFAAAAGGCCQRPPPPQHQFPAPPATRWGRRPQRGPRAFLFGPRRTARSTAACRHGQRPASLPPARARASTPPAHRPARRAPRAAPRARPSPAEPGRGPFRSRLQLFQ